MGKRQTADLLVEDGGQVLAALLDTRLAGEATIFIASELIAGQSGIQTYASPGAGRIADAPAIQTIQTTVSIRVGGSGRASNRPNCPRGAGP